MRFTSSRATQARRSSSVILRSRATVKCWLASTAMPSATMRLSIRQSAPTSPKSNLMVGAPRPTSSARSWASKLARDTRLARLSPPCKALICTSCQLHFANVEFFLFRAFPTSWVGLYFMGCPVHSVPGQPHKTAPQRRPKGSLSLTQLGGRKPAQKYIQKIYFILIR